MSVNAYYAAGRVAVVSTKLWTKEKFLRMAECSGIEDALRVLYENAYGGGAMLKNTNDYEQLLQRELSDSIAFFKEMTSNPKVTDCFLLPFDYLNAKILMKSKYMRIAPSGCFENATLPLDTMSENILVDNYGELPKEMQHALNEIDLRFFEQGHSPRIVDILLDKAMYRDILSRLRFVTLKSVKTYFKYEIDSANIMTLMRAKRANLTREVYEEMIVEGASLKKEFLLTVFDKDWQEMAAEFEDENYKELVRLAADSALRGESFAECSRFINKLKRDTLIEQKDSNTVETVICYYLSKLTEIDNIRMILIGIKNGLSKDVIKEMIKELYA